MKVLFFSPFAAIDKHEMPLIGLKEALEQQGHETEVMRCDKIFKDYCISMSAFGLNFGSDFESKKEICNRCTKSRKYFDFYFDQNAYLLNKYFTSDDQEKLTTIVQAVNKNNWWDFKIGEYAIGRIAAYEFYLHNKLNSREIPEPLWREYLMQLEYTLVVYYSAHRFFEQHKFDRVIVYNRLYSVNKLFCLIAEEFGVVTYTIEASGFINDFYSRFTAFRLDSTILELNTSREWEVARHQPLSATQVRNVDNHFLSLFKAESPWVYSQPMTSKATSDVRNRVGARPESKIILLAMSSMDEIFAVDMLGISNKILLKSKYETFQNQADWIDYVISIVSTVPNLHLVVRIHPRELPNKRENVSSAHAKDLLSNLRNRDLPKNVFLNTPDDQLSLYDLLQVTDVILNGNSTSGLEAALLGIPVIIHHPDLLTTMPPDFAFIAKSKADYKQVLMDAITSGKPKTEIKYIYRWYNFRFASVSSEFITQDLRQRLNRTTLFYKVCMRLKPPLIRIIRELFFRRDKESDYPHMSIDFITNATDGINIGKSDYIFGEGNSEEETKSILNSVVKIRHKNLEFKVGNET
jgi:hypothetical protein